MTPYKLKYSGEEIDDLLDTVNDIFDLIYPVGAIYISANSTNPGILFGGTWEQIQDTFLLAAGSTYSGGSTGGSATHTHTMEHTHTMDHTHTMAHTHTYAHTHTTPATTTGSHTLVEHEVPAHTHTRGTMNITGSTGYVSANVVWSSTAIGAFTGYTNAGGSITNVAQSGTGSRYQFNFDASKNWTGATSSYGGSGGHTHSQVATTTNSQSASTTSAASNATTSAASNATTSAASTSTTSSTSNLPPYLTVFVWKRTA